MIMTTEPGDLVLYPTCGAGTTDSVAERWGRTWITIDTSRVALALARTRLMAARFPYYYLADSGPKMSQMNTIACRDVDSRHGRLHQRRRKDPPRCPREAIPWGHPAQMTSTGG